MRITPTSRLDDIEFILHNFVSPVFNTVAGVWYVLTKHLLKDHSG